MKKTLIALSVLVAAGSVNAANVYDNDGVMVDVYGDFAVHYERAQGDEKAAEILVDDADFGFNFESAINEDMAVIANMDVTGEGDLALDDLTVGVKASGTTVKVGRQVTLVDDFGLSNDFAFGLSTAEDFGYDHDTNPATDDVNPFTAKEDEVVRVDYDSGEAFYAAFDAVLKTEGTDDSDDDSTQYDLMAGARFGDADVSVTYSDSSDISEQDVDGQFIGVKGAYTLGDVVLSAVYTNADVEDIDVDAYGSNIEYSMDKVGFNFGVVSTNFNDEAEDNLGAEDHVEYYANVSYALAKNSTVFFEVQDSDEENSDMGYAAGLTVSF
jgi:predicted porin